MTVISSGATFIVKFDFSQARGASKAAAGEGQGAAPSKEPEKAVAEKETPNPSAAAGRAVTAGVSAVAGATGAEAAAVGGGLRAGFKAAGAAAATAIAGAYSLDKALETIGPALITYLEPIVNRVLGKQAGTLWHQESLRLAQTAAEARLGVTSSIEGWRGMFERGTGFTAFGKQPTVEDYLRGKFVSREMAFQTGRLDFARQLTQRTWDQKSQRNYANVAWIEQFSNMRLWP
jgi:hypothetical protein